MVHKIRFSAQWALLTTVGVCLLALFAFVQPTSALNPLPEPSPKPGSIGLEATKTQPPPTQGATITTPGSGSSFANSPITVNGICPNGLLVQVYNNGVMVGSVMCAGGSFSIQSKVHLPSIVREAAAFKWSLIDNSNRSRIIATWQDVDSN